ncbi:MAG: 4Fe-4S dicluster domain-containing protein [Candidatus Lokiarchaeota archaeon]|nr:4Fe-4S dicluster domain-containing protein [Candidatus Lokiarchaeota archaeon]
MKIIEVDKSKCVRCEECLKECPLDLFSKSDSGSQNGPIISFKDEYNACIKCGHCLAICPTDAVIAEGLKDLDGCWEFEEAKKPSNLIDYMNFLKFIRARRSIRRFQDKIVPKEKIEKVLEAIRYAPSARNAQNWHFTIIKDKDKIKFFKNQVMRLFYLLKKILKFKFILKFFVSGYQKKMLTDPKTKYSINELIKDHENGVDRIFYDAPCVIVIDYTKNDIAGNDCGIALTHGIYAAQALGLGTCWIGYAQEAIKRFKKLKKFLEIPKNRKCYGVLILGYPNMEFLRAPPREKLEVDWL